MYCVRTRALIEAITMSNPDFEFPERDVPKIPAHTKIKEIKQLGDEEPKEEEQDKSKPGTSFLRRPDAEAPASKYNKPRSIFRPLYVESLVRRLTQ